MINKLDQKVEMEFRYTIPSSFFQIIPPAKIGQFSFVSTKSALLYDILIERQEPTFKSENIGLRVRKQDSNFELTYKKFLGIEDGLAKFDERTLPIDEDSFNQIWNNDFSAIWENKELLSLLNKGEIYILLEIQNKRTIYNYVFESVKIEVIVEEIEYRSDGKVANDFMLEIEIPSKKEHTEQTKQFVQEITDLYQAEETIEGKNSRGMNLLRIQ